MSDGIERRASGRSSRPFISVRIAGDPDPTVTTSISGSDTTVHIAWDSQHSANIVLSGVQLSNFVANQDYHLI